MITEVDLLKIVDAYAAAAGVGDTTISSRVFDDSKKLGAIRSGGTITLRRANEAVQWFSDNWPDGAVWPDVVQRPFLARGVPEDAPAAHDPDGASLAAPQTVRAAE